MEMTWCENSSKESYMVVLTKTTKTFLKMYFYLSVYM